MMLLTDVVDILKCLFVTLSKKLLVILIIIEYHDNVPFFMKTKNLILYLFISLISVESSIATLPPKYAAQRMVEQMGNAHRQREKDDENKIFKHDFVL